MNRKDYPLHPGQDYLGPQYVELPIEAFETMSKELEELRKNQVEWDLAKAKLKLSLWA